MKKNVEILIVQFVEFMASPFVFLMELTKGGKE